MANSRLIVPATDDVDDLFADIFVAAVQQNNEASAAPAPAAAATADTSEGDVKSYLDHMRERRKIRQEEQKKKQEEQEAELRQLEKYPSFLEMRSTLQRLRTVLKEVKKSAQESSLEGLLFAAARQGDSARVGHLLALDANVNARNADGQTPLLFAAFGRHKSVVKQLIEKGADLNAVDTYGRSILDHLAINAIPEMLEFMIHQMSQLDLIPRLTQAWHACLPLTPEEPYLPVRKILSNNMLRSSVKQGDLANTKSSISDFGADINFQDDYLETALHKACYFGHAEIVEFLLTAGARTDIEDHHHQKAVDIITSGEHKDSIVGLFKYYEFLRLVQAGNQDAVKKYLADHSDYLLGKLEPAKQEQLFTAALELPVSSDRIVIISTLFNVPAQDGKLNAPDRHLNLCQVYSDFGINKAVSPLQLAISSGDKDVVKLLIELSTIEDNRANKLTAVEFARSIGKTELADVMIGKFAKEIYKQKHAGSLVIPSTMFSNPDAVSAAQRASAEAAQAASMAAAGPEETKSSITLGMNA